MKKPKRLIRSYLSLAALCCLVLVSFFTYMNYKNIQQNEEDKARIKLERITADLDELQIIMKKICLKISINKMYRPETFQDSEYDTMLLLNNFSQYINYLPLPSESFLYYGDTMIYHSNGFLNQLDIYMSRFSSEARLRLSGILENRIDGMQIVVLEDNMCFIIPLARGKTVEDGVLCFVIGYDDLLERIQLVSGGIDSGFALYSDEALLCDIGWNPSQVSSKEVLTAATANKGLTVFFQVNPRSSNELIVEQTLPAFVLMALLMMVSGWFASYAFSPVRNMIQRYRQQVQIPDESDDVDGFRAIEAVIETLLDRDLVLSEELKSKQKQEDIVREALSLYRQSSPRVEAQSDDKNGLEIYKYMNEHFAEYDLSVEKIAEECSVSVAAVRDAIKKHAGKTYIDYLMFLRVNYAIQLLAEENLTVAEICRQVGYSNVSYFIKMFKKMTGTTPSAFKRDES